MESAILSAESKRDLKLLIELAEKIGIKARFLDKDSMEDLAIARAIDEGKTDEFIDTEDFLNSLK